MKIVKPGELEYGQIKSEGKLLEIIPILTTVDGQPMMLPPTVWHVDNELVGFRDYHIQARPYGCLHPGTTYLPSSKSNQATELRFIVRLMEDSEAPRSVPLEHVDAVAVRELLAAISGEETGTGDNPDA